LEQLAIPFLTTVMCLVPPIFVFIGVLLGHTPKTMAIGKFFMAGCTVLMILSIRIFEQLTFQCRWWNNSLQDDCKTAFNTFAAGGTLNCVTMVALLFVAVFHTERAATYEHEALLDETMHASGGHEVEMTQPRTEVSST